MDNVLFGLGLLSAIGVIAFLVIAVAVSYTHLTLPTNSRV